MNNPQPTPTPGEVLQGSIRGFDVTLWDGAVEKVDIRVLPVGEYETYARVMEQEARAAELFTGKPEGWGDTLRPDSLGNLIEEGERINAGFFEPWFRRRVARMERFMPGSVGKSSTSPSSLPGSVSSAASPASRPSANRSTG